MGYRTLVLLYNDQASEWETDPQLGKKIMIGMNDAMCLRDVDRFGRANLGYGRVVQCAHADQQTLAIVDGYSFTPVAHGFWHQNETQEDKQMKLLRGWADQAGYRLVKKLTKD